MKRSTKTTGIKRTLTALLLMFVLSFSSVFADTDTATTETAAEGTQTEVSSEAASETSGNAAQDPAQTEGTQAETPAAETPAETPAAAPAAEAPAVKKSAPAPKPVSRIIKKGKYYYYKLPSGKLRKKAGFVTDCGKKYYVRKGGKIRTSKTFKVNKKYYRADKYGVIKTGVYKWNGKLNYSNASGQWIKTEGFVTWNGSRYYIKKGGTIITNDCFTVNNYPYVADSTGRATAITIPNGDGSAVVGVAKKQVGIMTGKTYWTWYYKTKFQDTDRTPWCGAFVAWCFNAAGQYNKISVATKFGPLGYVPSYSKYATKNNLWINRNKAKGGDIIVFGSNQHVGLVEGVVGDYIITIEGNAGPTAAIGSKKPGAVVRNIYKLNSTRIKGIIRVSG